MNKMYLLFSVFLVLSLTGCNNKTNVISEIKPLDKKNLLENSTLHDAVRINNLSLVKNFIVNGEDINKKDKYGYTPLHLASRFNHLKIAKFLIKNGANINTIDKYNDTPLIDSTRNGYIKVSELLICKGANKEHKNNLDLGAYDYALSINDMKTIKLLKEKNLQNYCSKYDKVVKQKKTNDLKKTDKKSISINDYISFDSTEDIKICGKINDLSVLYIQLSFDNGKTIYDGNIDKKNKSWCVNIPQLSVGEYEAAVISLNSNKIMTRVSDKFKVIRGKKTQTLNKALINEFKDDFKKWDLEFLEDNLVFRFKSSKGMFLRGKNGISEKYKIILTEFFPRYLKVLSDFDKNINQISIQGHTSSRYRTAKTKEEKFEKNRVLSQKRADAILNFLKKIDNLTIKENFKIIKEKFKAQGKSSSQVLLKDDGSEDIEASRRVEIKIVLNGK